MIVSQTKWLQPERHLGGVFERQRKRPFDQSGGDGETGECAVAEKKSDNQIGALTK